MIAEFLKNLYSQLRNYDPYRECCRAVRRGESPLVLERVPGSLLPIVTTLLAKDTKKIPIFVVATQEDADRLMGDVETLLEEQPILIRGRAGDPGHLMQAMAREVVPPVVLTYRGMVTPVPDQSTIEQNSVSLQVGGAIEVEELADKLTQMGYLRVPRVSMDGEFSLRGEVFDIAMPQGEDPVRILFEWDQIDSIKYFSLGDQSSWGGVDKVTIYPVITDSLEESLGNKSLAGYTTVADYFPKEHLFITVGSEGFSRVQEILEIRETSSFFSWEEAIPRGGIALEVPEIRGQYDSAIPFGGMDGRSFFGNITYLQEEIGSLKKAGYTIAVASNSEAQMVRIQHILDAPSGEHWRGRAGNLQTPASRHREVPDSNALPVTGDACSESAKNLNKPSTGIPEHRKSENSTDLQLNSQPKESKDNQPNSGIFYLNEQLSGGFSIPDLQVALLCEKEIFGRRAIRSRGHKAKSKPIESFLDLEPGDFVVHVQYGIGKFHDIERITTLGNERDFIKLEYQDKEYLFVPLEQVNLVQKYVGQHSGVRLDRIGGKNWSKRKEYVRKKAEELAGRLVKLYARRQATQGFAFPPDTPWQDAFEGTFPYEETEDQLRCIVEVKQDMETPRPMDRLLCGDVGFGKTEVAIRAAFKAVNAGKQVAFLAPTTILAEQHFETLQERMKEYPISIGMVSRFVGRKDTRLALERLKRGEIDILVGTHRLIQKDVEWKQLGLMVIDEEQRFGVKDKERLKEIKVGVDCLSMSATPIPRTLHMTLLKIRDISLLTTAPSVRRPVETHIAPYEDSVVAEAIRKEVARGGQVFYLHNRIESLLIVERNLSNLVPELRILSAHGQMSPHELEDRMHQFIRGDYHVLIATTIIENGIDIPNANTIIIDRADMYGVSQLYQLRGRVGRSDRVAHAYLLYPEERSLSELAMKRLSIISDNTELGSGFSIAMKDLEVRGAGNLLGREQSGEIYAVGIDMFLALLEDAVAELQGEEKESSTLLELEYSGFIPDTYIDQAAVKMEVYKKIAAIEIYDDYSSTLLEITDRFGPLPEEVSALFSIAEIRIMCKELSITSLRERRGVVSVEFGKIALIPVESVMRLIRESGGRVKPDPLKPNVITMQTGAIDLKEKAEYIRDTLQRIME